MNFGVKNFILKNDPEKKNSIMFKRYNLVSFIFPPWYNLHCNWLDLNLKLHFFLKINCTLRSVVDFHHDLHQVKKM
jgi:hypothetical protein